MIEKPVLAGDVGGTNVRLALVSRGPSGIEVHDVERFDAEQHDGLEPIVHRYLERRSTGLRAAGFGIPGPVLGDVVTTTTLGWEVDRCRLERLVGAPVALLNDLQAAAFGIESASRARLTILQEGEREPPGNRAVLAPGTGLGEAGLVAERAGWVAIASEGGHTDFGPLDDEQVDLLRFLAGRFGHVSYERICCGPGLENLWDFHAERLGISEGPWDDGEDRAAAISKAALARRCPASIAALDTFCRVLGAEAGNLVLKLLATGGCFLVGNIPSAILPALRREDGFLAAFRAKGRYESMMRSVPVIVVDDPELALRGAALWSVRG